MPFMSFSNLFVAMETCIEETSLLAGLVKITEMSGLCLSPWWPCLLFLSISLVQLQPIVECAFCWKKIEISTDNCGNCYSTVFFPQDFWSVLPLTWYWLKTENGRCQRSHKAAISLFSDTALEHLLPASLASLAAFKPVVWLKAVP